MRNREWNYRMRTKRMTNDVSFHAYKLLRFEYHSIDCETLLPWTSQCRENWRANALRAIFYTSHTIRHALVSKTQRKNWIFIHSDEWQELFVTRQRPLQQTTAINNLNKFVSYSLSVSQFSPFCHHKFIHFMLCLHFFSPGTKPKTRKIKNRRENERRRNKKTFRVGRELFATCARPLVTRSLNHVASHHLIRSHCDVNTRAIRRSVVVCVCECTPHV